MMLNWKNLDTLASYEELKKVEPVNVAEAMSGENGAERVKNYSIPMMDGLTYNYAAKAVDDKVLAALAKLAGEAVLSFRIPWKSGNRQDNRSPVNRRSFI